MLMNAKNGFITLFLFSNLILIQGINGQSCTVYELRSLFIPVDTSVQNYASPFMESTNEIDITVSALFLFYKTFISSQDMPTCIFTPSCSEYTVQSMRENGIFIGWLSSFDRLSRCHGLVKPSDYYYDIKKNRFYDPVR